jgi:hypothetical protein
MPDVVHTDVVANPPPQQVIESLLKDPVLLVETAGVALGWLTPEHALNS